MASRVQVKLGEEGEGEKVGCTATDADALRARREFSSACFCSQESKKPHHQLSVKSERN